MVVTSALMCGTVLYGHHGMYRASLVATPLVHVPAVWVAIRSDADVGGLAALDAIGPVATMSVAIGALTEGEGDFVLVLFGLGLVGWGVLLLLEPVDVERRHRLRLRCRRSRAVRTAHQAPFIIAGAVIGTVLALTDVQNELIACLGLLGTFVPPLLAILVAGALVLVMQRGRTPVASA